MGLSSATEPVVINPSLNSQFVSCIETICGFLTRARTVLKHIPNGVTQRNDFLLEEKKAKRI